MSTNLTIGNHSQTLSSAELNNSHSSDATSQIASDYSSALSSSDDQSITASPLFPDNSSIFDISQSILSCIGDT